MQRGAMTSQPPPSYNLDAENPKHVKLKLEAEMSCKVLELVYHYQGQNVKYYFVYSTPPSNGSLHFVGRIILSYLGRFPLTEGLSCMSSHLQSENLKYEFLNLTPFVF